MTCPHTNEHGTKSEAPAARTAPRFLSRHSGTQLQQRANERDRPRQRVLARKLDAKRLRIRRAVVNVPSDTLPPSALYLPGGAPGGTSCSDHESFGQCCKVHPHKRDEKSDEQARSPVRKRSVTGCFVGYVKVPIGVETSSNLLVDILFGVINK